MNLDLVELDGSYGEGGGQILRSALSLSCLTGKPFRIYNIRKGREKPGLMPQHLTSVTACQRISSAQVEGACVGSGEFSFVPGSVRGGSLALDVGTAGSVCLILHALLPPLLRAQEVSTLTLRGGTHVPFSPPFHHFQKVFLHALSRTGRRVESELMAWGFYPRGGGHVKVQVFPSSSPAGEIELQSRGALRKLSLLSYVAGLPLSVARRQMAQGLKVLRRGKADADITEEVFEVSSPGKGTFFFVHAVYENTSAGFSSLGERGKRAEAVGQEAVEEFLEFHSTDAAVDPYLADQLSIYLALNGRGGYTTSRLTRHLLTNAWVIEKFLQEPRIAIKGEEGKPCRIIASP